VKDKSSNVQNTEEKVDDNDTNTEEGKTEEDSNEKKSRKRKNKSNLKKNKKQKVIVEGHPEDQVEVEETLTASSGVFNFR